MSQIQLLVYTCKCSESLLVYRIQKKKKTRKFNDLVFYSNGYWLSPGRVLQGCTELSTLKIFLKQRNNCQLSNNQWQKHGTWIYVPSPTSRYTWVYWIWNFKDSQFTCKVVGKVKIIHVETETSNIQANNDFTYFPNMINMQLLIATGNFFKCLQKSWRISCWYW